MNDNRKSDPVYWIGTIGEADDFGSPYTNDTMYDAATTIGGWANMSEASFKKYGRGLGLGKGQKYRRQSDGRWLKVQG